MGGIYLIEAKDYDEAVERTLDHPHLEHGTSSFASCTPNVTAADSTTHATRAPIGAAMTPACCWSTYSGIKSAAS